MRIVLSLVFLSFWVNLEGADSNEDMYIVVTALHKPGIIMSLKGKGARSRVICYPITYKKEMFYEKAVEEAIKVYLVDKDKDEEGTVEDIQVHTFVERKEATAFYKEMTADAGRKAHKRISFSRAHIDRARKLFEEEIEALAEKEKPIEKPVVARAIDDIYD